MPKSVTIYKLKTGNIISCPFCNYSLANNRKGMILHIKASHNMKAGINGENVPDVTVCFCGKKGCKNHQNKF